MWDPAAALRSAHGRQTRMLEDARLLVEVESPSGDRGALHRSVRGIQALADRELGGGTRVVEHEGIPHLRIGSGRPRVLVLGHHDTVWEIGSLDRIPFSLEGGIVRGPGCFDMKVGLVQGIHAMALLKHQLGELDASQVGMLITGDEETGSATSRSLIESEARWADAVLVLEPAGDDGAPKVARKGVTAYTLDVVGKSAHAGLDPDSGVNASIELAHQIIGVSRLGSSEHQTTVTPTTLSAGTTTNTVPGQGRLAIDVRTWTAAESERVDRALRLRASVLPGARVSVDAVASRPPFERSVADDLFERWCAASESCGVAPIPGTAAGGASDGNITAGLGVATLDGLGAVGGGAHAENEHVVAEHIPTRSAVLATLMADLVGQGPASVVHPHPNGQT